jgi:heat shock protein HtpX
MIDALEALNRAHAPEGLPQQMAAFGVVGRIRSGLMHLLMSHPPIEARIVALRALRGPITVAPARARPLPMELR